MALSVEDTGAQSVMYMAESLHTQMSLQEPACVNDERTCSFWGKIIGSLLTLISIWYLL